MAGGKIYQPSNGVQPGEFAGWAGEQPLTPEAIENAQFHLQSLLWEIQEELRRLRPLFAQEDAQQSKTRWSAICSQDGNSMQDAHLRIAQLTPREKQVWTAIAMGQPTKLIAHELGLTFKTVVGYRTSLMKKLGLHSVAHLTRLAIVAGLLTSSF